MNIEVTDVNEPPALITDEDADEEDNVVASGSTVPKSYAEVNKDGAPNTDAGGHLHGGPTPKG